ncbi:MAG: hypothetical protein WA628_13205 [Terriglobales bacterium]
MKPEIGWQLTIAVSRKDGTLLLFEPASGAHAQVKELFDSELALVEFTLVLPRFQAEELQDALTLGESDRPNERRWAVCGD